MFLLSIDRKPIAEYTTLHMADKINDEFTDLKLTRQRKWALRHPAKAKAIQDRYEASEARKEAKRLWHVKRCQQPSS